METGGFSREFFARDAKFQYTRSEELSSLIPRNCDRRFLCTYTSDFDRPYGTITSEEWINVEINKKKKERNEFDLVKFQLCLTIVYKVFQHRWLLERMILSEKLNRKGRIKYFSFETLFLRMSSLNVRQRILVAFCSSKLIFIFVYVCVDTSWTYLIVMSFVVFMDSRFVCLIDYYCCLLRTDKSYCMYIILMQYVHDWNTKNS